LIIDINHETQYLRKKSFDLQKDESTELIYTPIMYFIAVH